MIVVGSVVEDNFCELGYVILCFDGLNEVEFLGIVYVVGFVFDDIVLGLVLKFEFVKE